YTFGLRITSGKTVNLIAIAKEIGALIGVPVLLLLAWRAWVQDIRTQLPPWRNGIALTSLAIISLSWAAAILLDAPELLHKEASWLMTGKWVAYSLSHPLDIVAVILALALKREARLQAVLASML